MKNKNRTLSILTALLLIGTSNNYGIIDRKNNNVKTNESILEREDYLLPESETSRIIKKLPQSNK